MRRERLQELICQEANLYLREQSGTDSRFRFVTVTAVNLSKDLSNATLYWDTHDASKRGDVKKAFETVRGKLRKHLSCEIQNRRIPAITFEYDSRFEAEKTVLHILDRESRLGKGY